MYKFFLSGFILLVAVPTFTTAVAQKPQHATFSLFSYERTPCYGTCPAYKIVIHDDGRVEYEGKRYVLTKGKLSKTLDEEGFREVVDLVRQAQLFRFRDSYVKFSDGCGSWGTDAPSTNFNIHVGDRSKTIKYYHGCEGGTNHFRRDLQMLTRLALEIDKIIGIQDWIGTDQERAKFLMNDLN